MAQQVNEAFLGSGWAFPIAQDADGKMAVSREDEDIRQAIRIILGTAQGERVMRPDFGAGLKRLVFEPISSTLMAVMRHRVEEALITWEPRIDQITVQVSADAAERARGRLNIEIKYRIRSTNTFYNLVYPFYLLEGEPG